METKSLVAKAALCTALAVALGGCATVSLPAYTVSGSQSIGGSMGSVDAIYAPKGNVTATQIRNTAVGNVMLTEPVSNYVSNAFRLELRAAGVKMDSGPCRMAMKINDYAVDDLGFNATYISDIDYSLTKDSALYARNVHINFTATKFAAPEIILANMRSALAQNFDAVMQDSRFKTAFTANCQ